MSIINIVMNICVPATIQEGYFQCEQYTQINSSASHNAHNLLHYNPLYGVHTIPTYINSCEASLKCQCSVLCFFNTVRMKIPLRLRSHIQIQIDKLINLVIFISYPHTVSHSTLNLNAIRRSLILFQLLQYSRPFRNCSTNEAAFHKRAKKNIKLTYGLFNHHSSL